MYVVLIEQLPDSMECHLESGKIMIKPKPLYSYYGEIKGYTMPDGDPLDIFVVCDKQLFLKDNVSVKIVGYVPYIEDDNTYDPKLIGVVGDACPKQTIDRVLEIYNAKSKTKDLEFYPTENNLNEFEKYKTGIL